MTYVIAEAGSNHDGSLEQAVRLVDASAEAGADAVKFQIFRASRLYPPNCGEVPVGGSAVDFFELLASLELPPSWIPTLVQAAQDAGIDLLFSVFDVESLGLLDAVPTPHVKIASPELTHLPLLAATASTGRSVILSTGMSSLGDIEEALAVLDEHGPVPVTLLHCVTAYPCPPEDANLGAITALTSAFGRPVGYSDHTLDPVAAPVVATALGATVIEKHVTLGRSLPGPDHSFAIEMDELGSMVRAVRTIDGCGGADERLALARHELGDDLVATLVGRSAKVIAPSEAVLAGCDRRAIHAVREIAAGHVITSADVAVLRGERNLRPGLHPRFLDVVIGARSVRAVTPGDGLVWDDLVDR
jgi:sialic acid synthase SpsE